MGKFSLQNNRTNNEDNNNVTSLSISTITNVYLEQKTEEKCKFSGPGDPTNKERNIGEEHQVMRSQEQLCPEARPKLLKQIICAVLVSLTHAGSGTVYGFSGVTLPQFADPNNGDIYFTQNQASLFSSLVMLGAAFGGLMCGKIVDKIGHCKTMLVILPFTLVIWLVQAFATNASVIIAARAGLGILVGMINIPSTAYILEISYKQHRGTLVSLLPMAKQIGFLTMSILAMTTLHWRHMSLICGTASTILPFIGILFFPKSPRWLVVHGHKEEARQSLIYFRGKDYDYESELKDITKQVNMDNQVKDFATQCKRLMRAPTRRIFLTLVFISIFNVFHASGSLSNYLVVIFEDSKALDPYTSALLVSIVRILGMLSHIVLIDRVGRRPLYVFSFLVMSASHVVLGIYFYMQNDKWVVENLAWLQIATLLIYTFFMALGINILPVMQGELLPTSVRPIGMSILVFLMFMGNYIISQVYFLMVEAIGTYGTFWTYGAGCLMVSIFCYVALPEAKGLSLEEINNVNDKKEKINDINN